MTLPEEVRNLVKYFKDDGLGLVMDVMLRRTISFGVAQARTSAIT